MAEFSPESLYDLIRTSLLHLGTGTVDLGMLLIEDPVANSVKILEQQEKENERTRVSFRCEGTLCKQEMNISKKDGVEWSRDPDWPEQEIEYTGYLEVDKEGRLLLDSDGTVKAGPWSLLNPRCWSRRRSKHLPEFVSEDPEKREGKESWSKTKNGIIFSRVESCLQYTADADQQDEIGFPDWQTFRVTEERKHNAEETTYEFSVQKKSLGDPEPPERPPESKEEHLSWLEGTVPSGPSGEGEHMLEGSIVLDDRYRFTRDKDGRIQFDPYPPLKPEDWPTSAREEFPLHWMEHPEHGREPSAYRSRLAWTPLELRDEDATPVRDAVGACFRNLGKEAMRVASFLIDDPVPGDPGFEVHEQQQQGNGITRYFFRASGTLRTPIVPGRVENPVLERIHVEGFVDLTEDHRLVTNEQGDVQFGPWTLTHPDYWWAADVSYLPPETGETPDPRNLENDRVAGRIEVIMNRLAACLHNLESNNEIPEEYVFDSANVQVLHNRSLDDSTTEYQLVVRALPGTEEDPDIPMVPLPENAEELRSWLTDEVPVARDDLPPVPRPEDPRKLHLTLPLDERFHFVLDDTERVRLSPYSCKPVTAWADRDLLEVPPRDKNPPGPPESSVREAVRACLLHAGQNSIPLARFQVDTQGTRWEDAFRGFVAGSTAWAFEETNREAVEEEVFRVSYRCSGELDPLIQLAPAEEGIHDIVSEDHAAPDHEYGSDVEGEIYVDSAGRILQGKDGNVRFGPWNCIHPQFWSRNGRFWLADGGEDPRDFTEFDPEKERVFRSVSACLAHIRRGASTGPVYELNPSSFDITDTEPENRTTRYHYTVRGLPARELTAGTPAELESWLTSGVPEELLDENRRTTINGSIVLTEDMEIKRDEEGTVLFEATWKEGNSPLSLHIEPPEEWRTHLP